MCGPCVNRFCFCVPLQRGVFVSGIVKLVLTLIILIGSIVGVILMNIELEKFDPKIITDDPWEFMVYILHGIFSTIIFFTSTYSITLILMLYGVKKKVHRMILPYLIFGIIYMLAFLVIFAYLTPILVVSDMHWYIDVLTIAVLMIVAVFVGLCLQVYFYILTYSYYYRLKYPDRYDNVSTNDDLEMEKK